MRTIKIKNAKQVQPNETLHTIYTRRAVRKFKDKPVSRTLIDQVLDAGRMAPSAINRQPWKFYVLDDKEKISLLSAAAGKVAAKALLSSGLRSIAKTAKEALHFGHSSGFLKPSSAVFHDAPVVFFITAPKDNEWAPLDIGMCAQNIMLAARSLGLDTCPVGLGKYVEKAPEYAYLRIPATEQLLLTIVLGYGDEQPEAHERLKDNIVYL